MNVLIENVFQTLVSGLLVGAVYGLMCVGLGLIFGVMRVINFAQGEFLMLGMYAALYAFTWLSLGVVFGAYFGLLIALIVAAVVLYVVGILIHRFVLARSTGVLVAGTEGDGHYPQLIITLGVSLIIANGGLILFGSLPQTIRTDLSASAWQAGLSSFDILIFFNKARGFAFLVAVGVTTLIYLFVAHTRLGKMLRAAADNAEAALYMGINVERAHRIAFGLGAAITAVAGGLVATYYTFQPYVGLEFVTIMYAGVVLGGMGRIVGAFWGGLAIGLVQQLSTLVLPIQLQNMTIFVVFLLVVSFRPEGLFGRSVERV
jgi:branched-chain amino acid transport system permease protein